MLRPLRESGLIQGLKRKTCVKIVDAGTDDREAFEVVIEPIPPDTAASVKSKLLTSDAVKALTAEMKEKGHPVDVAIEHACGFDPSEKVRMQVIGKKS